MKKELFFLILLTLFPLFSFAQTSNDNSESSEPIEESTEKKDPIFIATEDIVEEQSKYRVERLFIPHRSLEFGYSVDFDVSNNYFNAKEMLTKELIIDFTKAAKDISSDGLKVDANANFDVFFNLQLNNGMHIGAKTGIESYENFALSKRLFEFLGYGNELDEKIIVDMGLGGEAFLHLDATIGFDIMGCHLELEPALYLPIFHLTTADAACEYINTEDGRIAAITSADLEIYSFANFEALMDKDFGKAMEAIGNGWGFDFYSSLERPIVRSFGVKVYSRMPIVPGSLNHIARRTVKAAIEVEKLTSFFEDDEAFKKSFEFSDFEYGKSTINLHRPFKLGTEFAWRPFGKWCTFAGLIGMGVKEPFSYKAHAFVEYRFESNFDVFTNNWDILGLKLSTQYINEVFKHSAAIMLNFHAVEINVGVAAAAGSFVYSLKGGGLGAYVMMCVGW